MKGETGVRIFMVVITAIVIAVITETIVTSEYRYGAIERGYALYCPADGDFAWKGECDDE